MCGVLAQIGNTYEPGKFLAGLKRLDHRGTRSRFRETSNGALGHVRLPIVGLGEENDQPVEVDPWLIGFVGEILNFKEIAPDLDCDVHLVAESWRRGIDQFHAFDGFWSVVAISKSDGSLHALTDYLGQKPVYYREDVRAVASEPVALLELGPVTLDTIYLSAVQKWGYCPEIERTPWVQVKQMRPGSWLVMRPYASGVRQVYVDPLRPESNPSSEELVRRLRTAVDLRLTSSDVPVGMLVSGGLDSTLTYRLARELGHDPNVYHVNNLGDDLPPDVRNVVRVDMSGVSSARALEFMQEPIDLGSLLPQVALAQAIHDASPLTRVVITGDGADELFGGYTRSLDYDSQASDVWQELVRWHLPRLDRIMMRYQLEVRSPYLARSVAELALGLPWRDRQNKSYLRKAARLAGVPSSIADRIKVPLKSQVVRDDGLKWSRGLVNLFKERS